MRGKGQGWKGESRRHGMARMGYKTVLPDGRRFHMGNFVAGGQFDMKEELDKILKISQLETEKMYDFSEDFQVDFRNEDGLQDVTYWTNIENPLVRTFSEDYTEQQVQEAEAYLSKTYPNASYDISHLKTEDYITISFGESITLNEIDDIRKKKNDRDKDSAFESLIIDKYFSSGANAFRNDWLLFYDGMNDFKKHMGVE